MNFLNPVVLFGLIAAGVPLLLHLLSKRRARELPFPSIRLLEQLKSDRIRLLKLKQILLLVLRTLIIAAIVMGFARPALRSTFRANASTAAVIIIDSTASMRFIDGGETLFDRATRRAGEIIGLLSRGDQAAVVVTDADGRQSTPAMTGNFRVLTDQLESLEPAYTGGDPDAAFADAFDLLRSTPSVNREVYYLTDGSISALPDSVLSDDSIRLYVITLGPEQHRGAVIERLTVENRVITPGRELTFRAEGMMISGETRDADISFILNGERRGVSRVVSDGSGQFTARFSVIPEDTGWLSAAVRAEGGFHDSAETARCVVRVPEPVRVLFAAGRDSDADALKRMLDAASADSAFVTTVRTGPAMQSFNGYDVIVLAGIGALDEHAYQSLLGAVIRDGAGLVIIPPAGMLPELYTRRIFRDLFPAEATGRIMMESTGNMVSAVIDRFDHTHPVIRGISPGGGIELAGVTSYVSVTVPPEAAVFARFDDGSVAAADMACGAGRAVLLAPDMRVVGDGLVYEGAFIPLFLRTVQYLTDTLPDAAGTVTREPVADMVPVSESVSQISVRRDNEPAVRTDFIRQGIRASLTDFQPMMPGFYSVQADGVEVYRLAVNLSPEEIVFQRAPEPLLDDRFHGVSWRSFNDTADIAASVTSDRYGTELAGFFLGAALILLAAEMLISRRA